MKFMRKLSKTLFFILLAADLATFGVIITLNAGISREYKIKKGEVLTFDSAIPITAVYHGAKMSQSDVTQKIGDSFDVELKAFGVIPFSTANVEVVDELYVAVLGTPFGMKLYTEGVLVIDMTDVETENGNENPARSAGIQIGDYIVSVEGKTVSTNEELSAAVESSAGYVMSMEILREGKRKTLSVRAVKSKENGRYRIGLWVRDSSAGIGTLTCYSPATGVVCGLGHGVCDEDTGDLLEVHTGELVTAEILSVEKGASGSPGELKGRFTYHAIGAMDLNSECGVYSRLTGQINLSNMFEVALKQEVSDGEAKILCTIDGTEPKFYDCRVKKRNAAYRAATQNLYITVTDDELLEKTGGIVQGMSGSPVIQNGKLIGAVTHVLVDNPTSGYGIYAENMLEEAKQIEISLQKEAS